MTPMKALVITFLLFVIVLFVLVAYSLCVMAKDEDDAEQAEWIRDQNKRGGNGGGEENAQVPRVGLCIRSNLNFIMKWPCYSGPFE